MAREIETLRAEGDSAKSSLEDCQRAAEAASVAAHSRDEASQHAIAEGKTTIQELQVRLEAAAARSKALSSDAQLHAEMHRESQRNYEQEVKWHAVDLQELTVARRLIMELKQALREVPKPITMSPALAPARATNSSAVQPPAGDVLDQSGEAPPADVQPVIERLETLYNSEMAKLRTENEALRQALESDQTGEQCVSFATRCVPTATCMLWLHCRIQIIACAGRQTRIRRGNRQASFGIG